MVQALRWYFILMIVITIIGWIITIVEVSTGSIEVDAAAVFGRFIGEMIRVMVFVYTLMYLPKKEPNPHETEGPT